MGCTTSVTTGDKRPSASFEVPQSKKVGRGRPCKSCGGPLRDYDEQHCCACHAAIWKERRGGSLIVKPVPSDGSTTTGSETPPGSVFDDCRECDHEGSGNGAVKGDSESNSVLQVSQYLDVGRSLACFPNLGSLSKPRVRVSL